LLFWNLLLTILNTNTNKSNSTRTTTMSKGELTTMKRFCGELSWHTTTFYYCSSS
jgi:hypothetical protein